MGYHRSHVLPKVKGNSLRCKSNGRSRALRRREKQQGKVHMQFLNPKFPA